MTNNPTRTGILVSCLFVGASIVVGGARVQSDQVSKGAIGEPSDAQPKLVIAYPHQHCIFQRTAKTGKIIIEGTCTGSPGNIEARFNGGPWTTISTGAKGGKFAGTLTAAVGQGTLEVRVKRSPAVTASVPLVSIGDIYVTAGQSNAAGWASVAYEPLKGLPYEMSLYKRNVSTAWERLRHPTSASGHGAPWPCAMSHLCKDHDVPIGLITAAISGAWLKQWLKSSKEHYPGMIETVKAATHGTMKVRALLWFQGEADCNPSRQYAHLSYNGDHDKYLANLKQLVSDVHRDMKLDTVYVGIIGSVPHKIDSSVLSTRENIYQIRRALQDCWQDPRISPGPVVYDVALESDPIHIHFNVPEEMVPFSRRWAAAISQFTYKTGVGRGPILQKAELAADNKTVVLTFDKRLKISDYKNRPGTKAEGWCFEQGNQRLTDADVASATTQKNVVHVRFHSAVSGPLTASYGIDDDGAGKKILRGLTDLPAEPLYRVPVTRSGRPFPSRQ